MRWAAFGWRVGLGGEEVQRRGMRVGRLFGVGRGLRRRSLGWGSRG